MTGNSRLKSVKTQPEVRNRQASVMRPTIARQAKDNAVAEATKSAASRESRMEKALRAAGSRIGFLVHDVSRMRRTLYDQAVRPLSLTRSQWWVLAQLSRHMGASGMPQTELARLLDVGKVTIGGLVDRLEERGFVQRRPDADDRRAKRVVVTAEGRRVLKRMIEVSETLNATIFDGFSQEEMRIAEAVLERMKANIRMALGER